MTTETFVPVAPYTIAGTGPYAIGHDYTDGAIRATAVTGETVLELTEDVHFTVSPAAGESGNLTLDSVTAANLAGWTLTITRETTLEQGFDGQTSREIAVEAQLDRNVQALQEKIQRLDDHDEQLDGHDEEFLEVRGLIEVVTDKVEQAEETATALYALSLGGGTVYGTITISGDGEELHAPALTINPDPEAASDVGAIDWRNKADVLRAKTYYNEGDDTWNIVLYDASGVAQGGATFGWNASYGVSLTTPVVNASGIFYGPDTNNGARIANIQGGYTIFGDIRSISMDWTTTPKRLYVSDSAASQTYYWVSDGTSDMRLKTNVEPIQIDAQADILALEFFQHDWLPEAQTIGHVDLAISAQQSEMIAFGSTHAVPRPENSPLGFDPLHVELRPWVLRLLRAFQQQQQEIDTLRAEIAALKGD